MVSKWAINSVSVGKGGKTSISTTLEYDVILSLIDRMSWIAIAEKGGNGTYPKGAVHNVTTSYHCQVGLIQE